MAPVTDVRDIARIAYGFKASKALLTAVELELFAMLSGGAKTLDALATETGLASNRLETLLVVLCSQGLLVKSGDFYANAPACEDYLVPGRPAYFGDYFRLQTDRFIFPAYTELAPAIRGEERRGAWRDYESLMQDSAVAAEFSRGQHAGSLGPAAALAKQADLAGRGNMLDVGGGSGAFTIMLCRRNPDLRATILDFPNALATTGEFLSEAGLTDRVTLAGGNATAVDWPKGHDVVLMSYLFSAVSPDAMDELLRRSFAALPSSGMLLLHDFMVDDDKTGPPDAALWFLTCMFNCADAVVLTPGLVTQKIAAAGFGDIVVRPLIPNLTRFAVAHKP